MYQQDILEVLKKSKLVRISTHATRAVVSSENQVINLYSFRSARESRLCAHHPFPDITAVYVLTSDCAVRRKLASARDLLPVDTV
jgi:hypothetical protein